MILIRPQVAGDPVAGGTPDGIPIASGLHLPIDWSTYGPSIRGEWYARSTSGSSEQCIAVEFIWDKGPCEEYPHGISHQELDTPFSASVPTTWTRICKSNPQRYAILFGAVAEQTGAPQPTVTVK